MTAQQIRELRVRLGLTTTVFALRLGVTVDAVRNYEQGKRTPTPSIMSLLEALDASTPVREVLAS